MIEPIPTDEEKRLAERLKLEARATRPAFSEALHERICRAVQHPEVRLRPRGMPWWGPRSRWLSVAVAASLLVGISLVAWVLNGPGGPGPQPPGPGGPIAQSPEPAADPDILTGPTVRTAEHVAAMVDRTVSDGKWAYLDHDARVALELLKNQLPFDVASIE